MSTTPPSASRDYESLLQGSPPDSPLALPSTPSAAMSGGVARLTQSMPGLALGKSVCILSVPSDEQNLCGASVGASGNVFCFLKRDKCTTEAHAKQRTGQHGVKVFGPGIYVRKVTANSAAVQVYGAPVGGLELLDKHNDAIMEEKVRKPNDWVSLFNDWARFDSKMLHEQRRTMKEKAKAVQTPIKRTAPAFSVDAYVSAVDNVIDETHIEGFGLNIAQFADELGRSQGNIDGGALSKVFRDIPFHEMTTSIVNRTRELETAIEQIGIELGMNRTWNEEAITTTADRVTELELTTGEVGSEDPIADTLWNSIQALNSRINLLEGRVSKVEKQVEAQERDLEAQFKTMRGLKENLEIKLRQTDHRMDAIESSVASPAGALDVIVLTEKVEELAKELEDMANARINALERLEALEAKASKDYSSVYLDDDSIAKSPGDVRAYLTRIEATHCDLGGFCDVYNVLIRIQAKIDGSGPVGDVLKRRKDARSVELSDNEAIVFYSFVNEAPPMLGGDKSDKSDIHALPTYVKWRNKAKQSGLGFEIQNKMKVVEREIKELITLSFKGHRDLILLSKDVLSTSLEFISKLVDWIDATYEVLVEGGNTAQDVWSLITKVARALFEEGMAPHRTTPIGTTFKSIEEQSSVLLWGVLRTHTATERMLEGDLRDHAVVTGNYAKWLVNNSGKKDALMLKKEVDRLSTKLTKVEEESATKRALNAVEKTAEAAKKVADKALAKAN